MRILKISNQYVTAFELEEDLLDFNLNALPPDHNHLFQWLRARFPHLIPSNMFSLLFDIIIGVTLIRGTSFHHHYFCHYLITPII